MKRRFVIYLVLLSAFIVPARAGADEATIIRVATSSSIDPERSGIYVWLKAFMDKLQESGVKTVLYPNSALGGEPDRTELVQLGLLQVNDTGSSEVDNLSHLYGVISLPFLFDDEDHFDRFFLETDFLDRVNAETAPQGVRVIDVAILGGMSGLFNTRKVVTRLEDLKGLRLRAMERTDLMILAAWNVPGTQVAWEEVPNALETGIAEGYINPPMVPVIFGHTSQIKFFTNIRMYPSTRTIVVSEKWYQSLSDQNRRLFNDAVRHACLENRTWAREMRRRELSILASKGVTISEISATDRAAFVKRARAIYKQLTSADLAEFAISAALKARNGQ